MAKRKYLYSQKIVSIGGGTGHFTWLRGVVKYNDPLFNAAVPATWDSGGSSGELRVEEGVLPPGDYMQCMLALMEDEEQLQEAFINLRDRSNGHPLVNLLAAQAEKSHHGVVGGIDSLKKLFLVHGQIIPVSLVDTNLKGNTRAGNNISREHEIDDLKNNPSFHLQDAIFRIYLDPPAEANPQAVKLILDADKIVWVAGSPRTSVIPHLLVKGIPEAVIKSQAKMIAVLNLMTTQGEDHDLDTASKWLKVFQYYLGDKEWIKKNGRSRLSYLVVNENHLDREILDYYKAQGQKPMEIDEEECMKIAPGLKIIKAKLAHYDRYSHILRHDPDKLAKTVLEL